MEIDKRVVSIRHNTLRVPHSKTLCGVTHNTLKDYGSQEEISKIGFQVCACLWVERSFALSTSSRKVVHMDILLVWDSLHKGINCVRP